MIPGGPLAFLEGASVGGRASESPLRGDCVELAGNYRSAHSRKVWPNLSAMTLLVHSGICVSSCFALSLRLTLRSHAECILARVGIL